MLTKAFLKIFALLSASAIWSLSQLSAVSTDPVGYVTNTIQPDSEALLSPALTRASAFSGVISAILGPSTIEVAGSPNWSEGQYGSNSHFLLVTSGDREGLWAVIDENGSDSVELLFSNQDLGSTVGDQVLVGDSVAVIPFWTLATLFPDGSAPDQSQVLVYNRSESGINKSAVSIYTMFSGFGWFAGPVNGNDVVVYPDESIVFRTPASSDYSFIQSGSVQMSAFSTVLSKAADGLPQDIRLTTGLPVEISLIDFLDSGSAADGDNILIFDNDEQGINKSAVQVATYFSGFGWFAGPTNLNDFVLKPGQGFIYRKASSNDSDILVSYVPFYLSNE